MKMLDILSFILECVGGFVLIAVFGAVIYGFGTGIIRNIANSESIETDLAVLKNDSKRHLKEILELYSRLDDTLKDKK